jgi:hypothetical protein
MGLYHLRHANMESAWTRVQRYMDLAGLTPYENLTLSEARFW